MVILYATNQVCLTAELHKVIVLCATLRLNKIRLAAALRAEPEDKMVLVGGYHISSFSLWLRDLASIFFSQRRKEEEKL